MRIATALRVLVAVLFIFALINLFIAYSQLSKMETNAREIYYTGKQIELVHRIAKLVYMKHNGYDSDKEIQRLTALMDKIIIGLVNGDKDLGLPRATNQKFIVKMKEVENEWSKFKDVLLKAKEDQAFVKELFERSESFSKVAGESVVIASHAAESAVGALKFSQVAIFLLGLVFLVFIWLLSTQKISKPLSQLSEKFQEIAKGDLTIRVDVKSNNEIGLLANSMNKMVHSLNSMINTILTAANRVISAVDIAKDSAEKTLEGAKNQLVRIQQIATASEEMSKAITDIAKNASVVSESSAEAMQIALEGKKVAEETIQVVNSVNVAVSDLIGVADTLSERAMEIGSVVALIKDIADQINLLALNAAIEAARAGEHGRGFAVVADEVRKLAERTIRATVEITEKIQAVQADSEQTAKSIEEASYGVVEVTDYIKRVDKALNHIVEVVQKVKYQISNIANAVKEYSIVSEEVAKNIEESSSIAGDMESMVEEVLKEISLLSQVAEELKEAAAGFKTLG